MLNAHRHESFPRIDWTAVGTYSIFPTATKHTGDERKLDLSTAVDSPASRHKIPLSIYQIVNIYKVRSYQQRDY
jgi:hypothetical protein